MGGVYFKYFDTKKIVVEEINPAKILEEEKLNELKEKISDLELRNNELKKKIDMNLQNSNIKSTENILDKNNIKKDKLNSEIKENEKILKNQVKESENIIEVEKKNIKNLVKDIEYTSIDQKGNKFHLLANSGKSNIKNNDILDLVNVRGKITSEIRDTIYIVSDFAQYNSVNLNSKFYKNVIINYQDKEITCINFDIDMETNKAVAYNDVLITDPKSKMKAGIVEFDLKTKNININPESEIEKNEVVTN